jgi:hypothetical protein
MDAVRKRDLKREAKDKEKMSPWTLL